MRAQELRVGNYVDTPVGVKRVVSIVSSADGSIYDIMTATRAIPGEENLFIDCELSPIPLTEELLLKCGFEKETMDFRNGGSADIYDNRGVLLASVGCSFRFCTWSENTDYSGLDLEYIGAAISYLHQIQNLYFALVGEEFEVKLD